MDECVGRVLAFSSLESSAITLDRSGDSTGALKLYKAAAAELEASVKTADIAHQADKPHLVQHLYELKARMKYLKGLHGNPPSIPVEEHIKPVQLAMTQDVSNTTQASNSKLKTVAACAGVGAAGAFVLLGGWVGTIPAVVGGAAVAGYAATRQDGVGEAARTVGGGVIAAGDRAQELNEKHHITDKMKEVAMKAKDRAKEVDNKYHVVDHVKEGAERAAAKAKEVDEKYHVADHMAEGTAKAFDKIKIALGPGNEGERR